MRCLVLFSGSLESLLAARLMQAQGAEVLGVFFAATCARRSPPQELADRLGIELVMLPIDAAYVQAIQHPRLGRTKGAAACLDCRVSQLRRTKLLMLERGASWIATGDVLGQRPRSQNRRDLEAIDYHADVERVVVRPLSSKLLPPTVAEENGWLDRERLFAFHGNAHRGLIALASELGLTEVPAPRTGCGLADAAISARTLDLLRSGAALCDADFQLLSIGRHFRVRDDLRIVVGRREAENAQLEAIRPRLTSPAMIIRPANFVGPTALAVGAVDADACAQAAALICRYAGSVAGERLRFVTLGSAAGAETLAIKLLPNSLTPIGG